MLWAVEMSANSDEQRSLLIALPANYNQSICSYYCWVSEDYTWNTLYSVQHRKCEDLEKEQQELEGTVPVYLWPHRRWCDVTQWTLGEDFAFIILTAAIMHCAPTSSLRRRVGVVWLNQTQRLYSHFSWVCCWSSLWHLYVKSVLTKVQ